MKRNDESFSVKGTSGVNYMINKLIVAVVAAVVSTAASVNGYVYAESNQYDEYTDGVYELIKYREYSDHIVIIGSDSSISGDVKIPEYIDSLPVTEIAAGAFSTRSEITTFDIPATVNSIGSEALTASSMPDLDWYYMSISFSLLNNITVDKDNPYYKSVDGVLFTKDMSTLIRVPPRKNGAYSVPSGVRTIAASAFKCSDIDEISFPDTLETIENNTFVAAQSLSSVVLPSSVSTVGYRAFAAGTFGSYMFKANIKEITFYNPMCEIGSSVILNSYIQENSRANSVYTGKIKGYNGSTAQAYAEANGITFESLGESPIPLTTTSATVTTAASASTEPVTTTETTPIDYDLGDVNEDGVVDAKDASTILVAYAKASTGSEDGLTEQQRSVSDVDNDVKVDAKDASSILAYYAMASTASGDVPSLKEYMTGKTS